MNRKGIIDPVTLVLIVGLGAGFVLGSWKPLNWLKKKPDTAQLTSLQAELAKAQADSAKAAKEAEEAKVAERKKLEEQVRAAQVDNAGTIAALAKSPKSPETKLASRMALRVDLKLGTAIGRLPEADRQAMIELIEQALSDKQAEVDEANRKLAAMDSDFKATTADRDALLVAIPKLQERAVKAEETAKNRQSEVTEATEKVKKQAERLYQAEMESGSLWDSVKKGVLLLGAIYMTLAFGLPAIVKHLTPDNPFKSVLRDVNGYFLNPLTYHDAKTKLTALNTQPPNP